MLKKHRRTFSAVWLWELNQNENTPRHVKAKGAIISGYPFPLLTTALNAIALSYLTTLVLPVVAMLAGKSSRLKALKRRLTKEG